MKLIFFSGLLAFCVWTMVATEAPKSASAPSSESPRAKVTVENWDKGGALSHWVYTHVSEVFPSAVIRRGGAILDLPVQIRPEIGGLKLKEADGSEQTLDQLINNGAVDACLVVHAGKIVYEKYPTIQPDDLHIIMSVTKGVVLAALAILEDQGKIDLEKPIGCGDRPRDLHVSLFFYAVLRRAPCVFRSVWRCDEVLGVHAGWSPRVR